LQAPHNIFIGLNILLQIGQVFLFEDAKNPM